MSEPNHTGASGAAETDPQAETQGTAQTVGAHPSTSPGTAESPAPQAARPTGGWRTKRQVLKTWQIRIFALSWLSYAAFYFPRNAFSAAKLGILDDGVMTKQHLGILDSAYLAAYAVGQFVWGALAERYGTRVVVAGGMAMAGVAALTMGIVPALWLFMPLMVVQGLAQSTGWSALSKNIASFFTIKTRGRAMGLFSTSYAFGGLVAVPVLSWIAYSVFHTWHAAFFAGATVIFLALALFLVFQRNNPTEVGLPRIDDDLSGLDEPHEHRRTRAPVPVVKVVNKFRWHDLIAAPRHDGMVLRLGIVYFLIKPARYAILLWGPVMVLEAIPELSQVAASMVPIAFGVAGVVAPVIAGWTSDTIFHARRIPPCVLSLSVLVIALALWQPAARTGSIALVAVLLGVVGLTAYGADAMVSGVAAVDFGTSKFAAGATGFINGCGSVGAIMGGLLPGFLQTSTVFYVFAAAAAVAALILAPCWNKRPNSE